MKLFSSFYHSLFDVEWLRARKNMSGKAWSYFFILAAVLSFISMLVVAVAVPRGIQEVKKVIQEKVPADFKATLHNGNLSVTGIVQPYVVKDEKQNQFIVVIDTITTTTLSLKSYLNTIESGVLIDREKVEFFDARRGQGQTQYWKEIPDFTIDRAALNSFIDKVGPAFIAIAVIIIGFVLFLIMIIGGLFNVLIVSLIVFIVASIAKKQWKFGELFNVGLYAITLPLLISLILQLFEVHIPYVQFLALLAFMLAIIFTKVSPVKSVDATLDTPDTPHSVE